EYTHFDLLVARTGPDGARYEFAHDAELRLTQVTNPQGLTWSYTYDPAGRLISETDFDQYTQPADGRTSAYAYDALGRRTRRVTPTGRLTTYGYDHPGAGACAGIRADQRPLPSPVPFRGPRAPSSVAEFPLLSPAPCGFVRDR
ncbi:RHS repeat domain-containing protein, partial [Streptomyces scopuliridis]